MYTHPCPCLCLETVRQVTPRRVAATLRRVPLGAGQHLPLFPRRQRHRRQQGKRLCPHRRNHRVSEGLKPRAHRAHGAGLSRPARPIGSRCSQFFQRMRPEPALKCRQRTLHMSCPTGRELIQTRHPSVSSVLFVRSARCWKLPAAATLRTARAERRRMHGRWKHWHSVAGRQQKSAAKRLRRSPAKRRSRSSGRNWRNAVGASVRQQQPRTRTAWRASLRVPRTFTVTCCSMCSVSWMPAACC
mmetsp:Transcript_21684/g.38096  ORF Transcript_21684/g.38096 Transcript_21684/m.38096 type:complete len:244 (-) Transcript_21684:1041-1772(-)